MTVTKLVRCVLCGRRAHPLEVVMVLDWEAHEACAEAFYARLAHAVGCSRAEGDNG